jgi:hypothetical protein
MMAADSLRSDVPSGMSFCCLSSLRRCIRTARARIRRSRPTCRRLASNAPGLRPWRVRRRAGCHAAAPPGRCLERQRRQRRKARRTRHRPRRKPVWARHGAASPPCRVGREVAPCRHVRVLRTTDTPKLAGSAAMTDRRDDDFACAPAPRRTGARARAELRFQGAQAAAASSGKSAVRRPGAAGTGQRPGSRLGRGHTAARFAGGRRPCRGA